MKRPPPKYVFCERPKCPTCGSTEHRAYRSEDQRDGSRLQYAKCKACGEKFRIILE